MNDTRTPSPASPSPGAEGQAFDYGPHLTEIAAILGARGFHSAARLLRQLRDALSSQAPKPASAGGDRSCLCCGKVGERKVWSLAHADYVCEKCWFAVVMMEQINALRADEGNSVTLMCDNPDFNGQPNCAIEVNSDWTNYEDLLFTGETLNHCLLAALDAKRIAAEADTAKPTGQPSQPISLLDAAALPPRKFDKAQAAVDLAASGFRPCPTCGNAAADRLARIEARGVVTDAMLQAARNAWVAVEVPEGIDDGGEESFTVHLRHAILAALRARESAPGVETPPNSA